MGKASLVRARWGRKVAVGMGDGRLLRWLPCHRRVQLTGHTHGRCNMHSASEPTGRAPGLGLPCNTLWLPWYNEQHELLPGPTRAHLINGFDCWLHTAWHSHVCHAP